MQPLTWPSQKSDKLLKLLEDEAREFSDQAALIESIISDGDKTLEVDLPNYRSLFLFAAEIARGYRTQVELSDALTQRIRYLEAAELLRNFKRRPGRPKKVTLGDIFRYGLLGSGGELPPSKSKKQQKKRGRPPLFTVEDQTAVVKVVEGYKARSASETGKPITDKAALELMVNDLAPDKLLHQRRRMVGKLTKALSRARRNLGVQLHPKKSRNSAKN